jgi:hypothetical protein
MKHEDCKKIAKKELENFKTNYESEVAIYLKMKNEIEIIYTNKMQEFIKRHIESKDNISNLLEIAEEDLSRTYYCIFDERQFSEMAIFETLISNREMWIEDEYADFLYDEGKRI